MRVDNALRIPTVLSDVGGLQSSNAAEMSGRECCWSCFVFFFSSRRRHTRFDCDWSSDVCSSDLLAELLAAFGGDPVGRPRVVGEYAHLGLGTELADPVGHRRLHDLDRGAAEEGRDRKSVV